ncbi:glycyl-radical enzyme activating protein [Alkaliphilus sp. MSJ-5]|uniref:Glycyl-radical enzyme activating protein n=1 Tax=Alkaliphilus flagellatus TaxID=2841507 RepID=A0ABS6G620_9FIRM|nr:glycyl-radical enzyme activating protein [Alkaliphilus flagellatus]MBU5677932.1 glycyl-radical enzyme activating protein [Alkaliphilus flagellatus]
MITGTIFNIQKYSINDGPGIRTTVFFKGCPLKCTWCHNPESQSYENELIFSIEKCIYCNSCNNSCVDKCITFIDRELIIDKAKCSLCGDCTKNCPTNAIEMVGISMTVNEVMKEIEKDMVFYEESGGGVTLSGGEPLMQFEFINAILKKCKEKGIHTAIDTSGYSSLSSVYELSKNVDLFLYDIKHLDDDKHMELTGVSNKQILDNLSNIVKIGNNVWIRVPIIPGINDDDENILGIGRLMNMLKLADISILPYHNIATDKYRKLGKTYDLSNIKTPSDQYMNKIASKLKNFGLNVKVGG